VRSLARESHISIAQANFRIDVTDVLQKKRHTTCHAFGRQFLHVTQSTKSKSAMAHRSMPVSSLRRQAMPPPIRTVCAWCAAQNRPAAVLVDVPLDARGISHGICRSCRTVLKSDSLTTVHGPRSSFGKHGRVTRLR
jgi:hypothetical protein